MIELRWYNKSWDEWGESSLPKRKSERVLQYRWMENTLEIGLHDTVWSDWQDVPEVFIEEI